MLAVKSNDEHKYTTTTLPIKCVAASGLMLEKYDGSAFIKYFHSVARSEALLRSFVTVTRFPHLLLPSSSLQMKNTTSIYSYTSVES